MIFNFFSRAKPKSTVYIKHTISNATPQQKMNNRMEISKKYLRGQGLEIGALNLPLFVAEGIEVKYVDLLSADENRSRYPELRDTNMIKVDIIDDGEVLSKTENNSLDFIIANHFLEHTKNPIGTIEKHLSKLKTGGVLYYALPNKDYTFDKERELTSIEHLISDYENGGEESAKAHYDEWVRKVDKIIDEDEARNHVQKLMKIDNRIHFHVWDGNAIENFFLRTKDLLKNTFEVRHFSQCENEIIVILEKK